jgi:hypothetical protein
MAELISIRAYARHRGVVMSAVQYAIKTGRVKLHTDANGKKGINQEEADQDWLGSTESGGLRRGRPVQGIKGQKEEPKQEAPEPQEPLGQKKPSFMDAKTATQVATAEIMRLQLLEKRGQLVKADDVRSEAFRVGRQVRDNLMNIPSRTISRIRGAVDEHEAYQILEDEIRKACEGLPNE